MSWNLKSLIIAPIVFVVSLGLNLVTTPQTIKRPSSEEVNLAVCSFKFPDISEVENCSRNTGSFSQCTCARNRSFAFCSSKEIHLVPEVPSVIKVLLLDHNVITTVSHISFRNSAYLLYLDLSYNDITSIERDSFARLHKLDTLLLHHNKLVYNENGLFSIDFRPLFNVKCLRIEQAMEYEENAEYPIGSIQSLKNLHTLYMSGLPGRTFDDKFLKLVNLQDLVLNGIDGYCNISRIERETFENLTQITGLSLINCNLTFVDNRSFSALGNLKRLNMSYNEGLYFESLRNITYSLINLTKFESLNLTKIHYTFGKCTFLDANVLQYINQTTVSKLILDVNRLSGLSLDAVRFLPKRLTLFSINKNKMDLGLYLIPLICDVNWLFKDLQIFECSNQNYRKRAIKLLSLFSRNSVWSYDKYSHSIIDRRNYGINITKCFLEIGEICKNCITNNILPCIFSKNFSHFCFEDQVPIPFPKNLETVDISGSLYKLSLNNVCLCKPNSLLNLNLHGNLIYSFTGPFYGFDKLQTLDLSENYCQNITEASFRNMTSLRHLNLSSNYLGSIIHNFSVLLPFKNLENLQQLDFSNNKIRTLPFHLFSKLRNLRFLSLSENRLSRIDVNMRELVHLKYLNLSGNLIESFSDDVIDTLDKPVVQKDLKINLFKNKFICSCKYENYIKWIVRNKKMFVKFKKYYCYFDNGDIVFLRDDEILNRLREECSNYTTIMLVTSMCVGIILIGIVLAVLYRYRWRIRYMYYSAKLRYKGYSRVDNDDHFQYDIFVSYADTDKGFVRESMIPELEQKRGLRLLIHERDFAFGQQVIENIHNAISSSRKTLLFISHGFLQSKWCKYEMNIAKIEEIRRDKEVLCVVMKGLMDTFKLPAELTEIMAKNTYLTVPGDESDLERFWDTIQCSV